MDSFPSASNPTPAPGTPEPFELEPSHPGAGDQVYLARRRAIHRLGREYRLERKGIPEIDYTAEEDRVWAHVCERLDEAHRRHACDLYREGKRRLGLDPARMPRLDRLDARTSASAGLRIVPAEGMVPVREFFGYLSRMEMPCTQYLRHPSRPEYTPEPDAVHDVLGHVPLLMDPRYAAVVRKIGAGGAAATNDLLPAFARLYWFAVEFGLIEERGEVRIFGAGLLSSFGEMRHALSDGVSRLPFDLGVVVATDYDPARMQDRLFVLPSLDALEGAVDALAAAATAG